MPDVKPRPSAGAIRRSVNSADQNGVGSGRAAVTELTTGTLRYHRSVPGAAQHTVLRCRPGIAPNSRVVRSRISSAPRCHVARYGERSRRAALHPGHESGSCKAGTRRSYLPASAAESSLYVPGKYDTFWYGSLLKTSASFLA